MVSMLLFLLLLTACTNDSNDESAEETPDNDAALENDGEDRESDETEQNDNRNEEENGDGNNSANTEDDGSENEDSEPSGNTEGEASDNETDSILDGYSAEEIEYARIWMQLSELEEPSNENLYVRHISAGEPLNEVDEESAAYPEDVTVLDGGRQPGVITYSSNGDGTINVYNIPPRWGNNAGEEALQNTYQKILEEVELVEVETGNPEDVKKVIDAYLIIE